MIAIVNSNNTDTSRVVKAMREGFKSVGVSAETFCTKPGKGVSLLEVKE
jgi:hypothetical protein